LDYILGCFLLCWRPSGRHTNGVKFFFISYEILLFLQISRAKFNVDNFNIVVSLLGRLFTTAIVVNGAFEQLVYQKNMTTLLAKVAYQEKFSCISYEGYHNQLLITNLS
jgi:hypothetical protein